MSFIEKLIESIQDKKSVVCMGLDPQMDQSEQIPNYLIKELEHPNQIILEFNKGLIENCHDIIPVIKPQIAFYEKYEALNALKETIKFAQKNDLLVILDSKRNDIGSTSEAYAYTCFKNFGADASTVNAYFGFDGVKPFLDYKEKGIFILVKTSNSSSKEFQNLFSVRLDNIPDEQTEIQIENVKLERNYINMARLIQKWSINLEKYDNFHNLGAVVGATFPNELEKVRAILNNSFILIPGYGTQGGTAKSIRYGINSNGLGGIVNSSRGIMFAYSKNKKYPPEKYGEAAREEIKSMNKEINKEIGI